MTEPVEDPVEAIRAMGIVQDENQIRAALEQCNNNPQVEGEGGGRGGGLCNMIVAIKTTVSHYTFMHHSFSEGIALV